MKEKKKKSHLDSPELLASTSCSIKKNVYEFKGRDNENFNRVKFDIKMAPTFLFSFLSSYKHMNSLLIFSVLQHTNKILTEENVDKIICVGV